MSLNKISAEITAEQETQVIQQINDSTASLGFLVGLSGDERVRLAKMSRRSLDFVERGLVHAESNSEFLPAYMELEEFRKDVTLAKSLLRISAVMNAVDQKIKDTLLLVEAEAYQYSRIFYHSVKKAAKEGLPAAERIFRDLAYHYKKPTSNGQANGNGSNDGGGDSESNPDSNE